ncbi:MAG: CpsD/CapB family tyrosine-protein kinase, partial [Duncaniella sp.]|nr:CpsD/CapB family tyrosine-protein kinase [Duncaniella sp.]
VMMMTSFNAGSGKSFISLNIGAVLAIHKKGVKVLAIDLDLRRASLSAAVNSPGVGIADYLSGADISIESTVCHTECPGLDIIPVGSIPPNPSELLYTERMKQIMAWAKENYDYVMLDCPPVEIVTDASIINQFVDITLFVVRVGLLDRRMLAQLDRYYAEQKYRNLAVILNGTMASANKYSSYYNKNYYHSDYYHSDE